jgi:error-prone DNA polymerase
LAEPDFFHPDLEPVLAPTFGVVVFHEQVISILSVMTGCSLARAEVIRRELGAPDKMAEIQEWFEGETRARGYAAPVRSRVWQVLAAFASFGFCKAHAAAFAWPTFQSAWVKAHYPAAFYAGVLTHDPGMYPKRLILDDARNFGVTVLPLEINSSKANWQVEKGALRVALSEVKGISADEVQSVVANAPYLDIEDFRHRAQVSIPILEGLVKLGAFDCLYRSSGPARQIRRDLLLHVRDASSSHAAAAQLALSLTGGVALGGVAPTGLPAMTTGECVQTEIENLNLDLTCHLIDFYRELLSDLRVTPSKKLLDCRTGQTVLVAGVKVSLQTPPMRSGKRVIFITLDDSTGPVDVTFFEDVQVNYASTVFSSWLLLAKGVVRRTGARGVSVRALGCWGLGEIREGWLAGGVAGANHLMTPRKIAA